MDRAKASSLTIVQTAVVSRIGCRLFLMDATVAVEEVPCGSLGQADAAGVLHRHHLATTIHDTTTEVFSCGGWPDANILLSGTPHQQEGSTGVEGVLNRRSVSGRPGNHGRDLCATAASSPATRHQSRWSQDRSQERI